MRPGLWWCWTPTTKGILWCCARRIAALYGLQLVRLLLPRRLDLGLVNHLAREEEREIRFGCSREIQLFTGTNPVTELVARGDRCDTLWSRGATSRLNWWHYTGDNILVTLYASHNMLVKLYWWHYSVVTLISHQAPFTLSGDTVQYFWWKW